MLAILNASPSLLFTSMDIRHRLTPQDDTLICGVMIHLCGVPRATNPYVAPKLQLVVLLATIIFPKDFKLFLVALRNIR